MDEKEFNRIVNNKDLYETNNHLIRRFYRKYRIYCFHLGYDLEDLIQEIWFDIWQNTLRKLAHKDESHLKCLITKEIKWALSTFKKRKLKISKEETETHFKNKKNYSAFGAINTPFNKRENVPLKEIIYAFYPNLTAEDHKEVKFNLFLESFSKILNEKEKVVLDERFIKNEKFKDIAKKMGISTTYVVRLYNSILLKLKKGEENENK